MVTIQKQTKQNKVKRRETTKEKEKKKIKEEHKREMTRKRSYGHRSRDVGHRRWLDQTSKNNRNRNTEKGETEKKTKETA